MLNKWVWDASGQYGHNSFAFTIGNTLNVSLGPTIPPNQTEFDAGTLALNQFVGNVDLTRPFSLAGAGPINVAFGTEYRREQYEITAGEVASYNDGGVANQAGAARRSGRRVPRVPPDQRGERLAFERCRLPGCRTRPKLVQRHPDLPQPFALRHERADVICADPVDALSCRYPQRTRLTTSIPRP